MLVCRVDSHCRICQGHPSTLAPTAKDSTRGDGRCWCVSQRYLGYSGILYDACRWRFPKDLDVAVRTAWSRAASIAVTEFLPALPTGAQTSSCSCASCMSSTSRRGTTHTCLQDCAMHWGRRHLTLALRDWFADRKKQKSMKRSWKGGRKQLESTISHQKQ